MSYFLDSLGKSVLLFSMWIFLRPTFLHWKIRGRPALGCWMNDESQWSILQRICQCWEAVVHLEEDRSMPRGNDWSWKGSINAERQWLILKEIDQIIYHLIASCLSQWTKTGEIALTCHQKTGVKKSFSVCWSEIHLWLRACNFFCFSIPDHIFVIFTTLLGVKSTSEF